MANARENPLGRRRFLKGAAASAAALVAKSAPISAQPQEAGTSRTSPTAPPNAQLAADTEPPPRRAASRIVERPGSDFMVDVIKSLGFEYVAANPGSSFEGLHESIINYGDNKLPELLTCCHEESSVAMAHGYAKIEGKPMLAVVHGNIGLQHASMAIYNAYADRVPVVVIAGNWRDAGTRANGVNSYHSAQDMALIVRDYVKWDDEPASLTAFAESAVRAYKIAMTPPTEPVLLVIDHDVQLRAMGDARPRIPRLTMPSPPAGEPGAVRESARLLVAAENPRINAGRAARTPNGIALLVELAELLQAPVNGGGDRVNFPSRHPQFCGMYPVPKDFEAVTGLRPDLLFLVGCQGVHGAVSEPSVMQIGPNPLLMGRHYPLDVAVQCELRETLRHVTEALKRSGDRVAGAARQRAKVRAFARLLIEREENLVREHEHDPGVHPSVLEAQLADVLPKNTVVVQESSTARTTLLPFGHGGMTWTRSGGGSLGFGVGAAIGAKIAVGRERPVVCHLGDGALGYSAAGFWTMARYNTAILTVVSNNESYQVVRHNWHKDMPDAKMFREDKYPGLWLSAPAVDYVGLARSQGVEGESVTSTKELEPALRRGMEKITRENRPYLIDVSVAREGVGAESTWYQDWQL